MDMQVRAEREFLERLDAMGARLRARATAAREEFAAARPFPHVVLDDAFDPWILDRVLEEFPGPKDVDWIDYDTPHERKLATRDPAQIPLLTRAFIGWLNAGPFIEFVEEVSGMGGLIPDPHLDGGGLHAIPAGGKLGLHTDFLRQQRLQLDRRLNLILYLNKDWKEEWGGHLEMWTPGTDAPGKRVLPVFNRLVLFATTATSLHGHPDPLACPPGRFRRSIALYYYTNGRPAEETVGARPTLFQLRPNERVRWKARQILRRFVPPILNDLRYLRRGR